VTALDSFLLKLQSEQSARFNDFFTSWKILRYWSPLTLECVKHRACCKKNDVDSVGLRLSFCLVSLCSKTKIVVEVQLAHCETNFYIQYALSHVLKSLSIYVSFNHCKFEGAGSPELSYSNACF
jgi:hypothetical protein